LPVVILSGGLLPKEIELVHRLKASLIYKTPAFSQMVETIRQGITMARGLVTPPNQNRIDKAFSAFTGLSAALAIL
jgi:hypothetical protein